MDYQLGLGVLGKGENVPNLIQVQTDLVQPFSFDVGDSADTDCICF
jgi:hypothetical protein